MYLRANFPAAILCRQPGDSASSTCHDACVRAAWDSPDVRENRVRYIEFQMSAHMPLPSDDLFDVASDPARLHRWIPTDLGPRARAQRWDSNPGAGVVRSRDQRRVEWCTVREGCHTALQVYPTARGSRVTIRVCMPHSHDGQPPVDPQLRKALRRLKRMAAPSPEPRAPDVPPP